MKGTPIIPPVCLSATYKFKNSDELIDVVQNRNGYLYSRWDNPTVVEAEKELALMEHYDKALGFSSGMAAITTAIISSVKNGDRIVSSRQVYGATFEFLNDYLPQLGVETTFVDCWDTDGFQRELAKGATVLYLESPTNPLLRVLDIAGLTSMAHDQDCLVFCDSTFASPINQHPSNYGVDITIHSATKYLGGHHDITAGFLCCNKNHYDQLWSYRKVLGGVMDPMTAMLAQRGMQTLALRINCQNQNALAIAKILDKHESIDAVYYPGLQSHPDYSIAKTQLTGFGGMMSFEVKGDFDTTKLFVDSLKVIKIATSLGGVSTLINQPITNTHVALTPENRSKAGIKENLVRLSVGVESLDKLIGDLKQALAKLKR